jgi:glutaredoxin
MKLVVYYTQWCPHCPKAKEVAKKVAKKLSIDYEEIDVGEREDLARKYRITAVPTIYLDEERLFIGTPLEDELFKEVKKRMR